MSANRQGAETSDGDEILASFVPRPYGSGRAAEKKFFLPLFRVLYRTQTEGKKSGGRPGNEANEIVNTLSMHILSTHFAVLSKLLPPHFVQVTTWDISGVHWTWPPPGQ